MKKSISSNTILIIDDEPVIRRLLSKMMELEGYEVWQAADRESGMRMVKQHQPHVVLCDVFLPDGNGVDMIESIRKALPNGEVILLTAHGNIEDGVQAIKAGAFDYITKGNDNIRIIPIVSRAMQAVNNRLSLEQTNLSTTATKTTFDNIIGRSATLQQCIRQAEKVAKTDIAVLICGETGTGKEVFAESIHHASARSKGEFMAINCAAFSNDLLESELFGYKPGAFTGATQEKKGLVEVANGGTLFLDEIGEMAMPLQAKLLRVLESGDYIKLGDTRTSHTDVRIISATNRNLRQEIERGNFREDLFYRLSVFEITLPPLRERIGDIDIMAQHFIEKFCSQQGKAPMAMTKEFRNAINRAPWHGNIRELRNVIERGVTVCDEELTLHDLPLELQRSASSEHDSPDALDMASIEKRHIIRVLQSTNGNKTETAKLLKIGITTLYRKIEEYAISL